VPQEKMWLNYNTAVCHFICIAFKVYNFDHVNVLHLKYITLIMSNETYPLICIKDSPLKYGCNQRKLPTQWSRKIIPRASSLVVHQKYVNKLLPLA